MIRPSKPARPAARRAPRAPDVVPSDDRIPLRLAVTRGGLGIELAGGFDLGPLAVEELFVSLVGLVFPVDLSGGVPRFRHRRGALDRLVVRAKHERVVSQLAPRLRGLLGPGTPALTIAPIAGGVMFGLVDGLRALAFDALWAPRGSEARWIVGQARSVGLATPSLAAALRAADALAGRLGVRQGAVLRIPDAAGAIAREILPAAGARAPSSAEVRWGPLDADASGWLVVADRTFSPPMAADHVVREAELAELAEGADHALAAGDLDDARAGYVALLERAPRHAGIARRIAEIDRVAGGRVEAALATIVESIPAVDAGILGAELLAATDDRHAARAALCRAAEQESYGALAALALLSAANLAENAKERLELLGEAVARAPALAPPRWTRLEAKLDLADFDGAMADAEHLEAAARGAHARNEVWARAAELFLARGHDARAIGLFERALRYVPDSPTALAGLARGLLAAGRTGRALDLLARAVELGDRDGRPSHDLVLSLARALADKARDLPAAIARVRSIPAGQPETLEARGLEARWRAKLGDVAGASIAFARMRDWIEVATELDARAAARWLAEAAKLEREAKDDPQAAQRHLGVALRLSPRDRAVASAFRQAAADALARGAAGSAEHEPDADEEHTNRPPPLAEADDEQLAVTLSDRLRGDPTNHAVVTALADVLLRLGRDLELFALLSARLEDATGRQKDELVPRQRAVLERLARSARADGRDEEATLYEESLAQL